MASKSIIFALFLVSVIAVSMAMPRNKRETKATTRPETPMLPECEEPGENRENCFLTDPSNLDVWKFFLEEVETWEKENPEEAKKFNEANPTMKKEEQDKLAELEKLAKIHGGEDE